MIEKVIVTCVMYACFAFVFFFLGRRKKGETVRQYIKFSVLSDISTATRFIAVWVGNAIAPGAHLVVVVLSEFLAQTVNFFVQMKLVFKSTASFSRSAPKYAILAMVIVATNSFVLPNLAEWIISRDWIDEGWVRNVIVPFVGTLLAVSVSFPALKFWIAPGEENIEPRLRDREHRL